MNEMTEHVLSKRKDQRTVEELIRLALTEQDEEAAWEPVTVLQSKGDREVLEAALRLCTSSDGDERALGANILGQLGVPNRSYPNECFDALSNMLGSESDPIVAASIGVAFGHLGDPRAIPILLPLRNHTDPDVRFGVVQALTGHDQPEAIAGLIQLSEDADEDVRDWATFALGTISSLDTPEIRNALFARTSDPHDDTRCEGLAGLANRKDSRVIEPLLRELTSGHVSSPVVEAALAIGDPKLYPALVELQRWWPDASDAKLLENAIARCVPR